MNQNISTKELGTIALFSLIFGSMMGSGVFDIPENITHDSNLLGVLIGWGITAIGIMALAFTFIYISKKRPHIQSGIYGYAKHGFGDYIGFNAAWGYALNSLLANASYLIYICATLGNFAIFKFFGIGNNIASIILQSLLIWLVYFLIASGIKQASLINIFISTIKILALFAIILFFALGFNYAKFKSHLNVDLSVGSLFDQVKSTMLITVWDFTGIEAACIFALRAKSPHAIARATILGAISVVVIDVLISVLPFGILSPNEIRQLTTPSTAGVLTYLYNPTSAELIRIAVIISVTGALLAWSMLATNIFHLAATDKTMPKCLTKLNNKNVPINSLLFASILTQIFVFVAYFTDSVYIAMIKFATSLILLPYFLSALFALKVIITDKQINYYDLFKGSIATLYGVWLVYSGGLKYLALSSIMYLIGSVIYFKARREQNLGLFANRSEQVIFFVLIIVAIYSTIQWYIL